MTTNQEGGPLEKLKSLEAWFVAGAAWLATQIPVAFQALYDLMILLTQVLAFVLVACKVIESVPKAIESVKGWFKKGRAREDP